jgi:molecular chaperone GrpE
MKGTENHKKKKNPKPDPGSLEEETKQETAPEAEKKIEVQEEETVDTLRRKLEEKEKESKENHDRMLRVAADFDNYRKRMAREKDELIKFSNEDVIKAILPFIDNLERAVDHSEKTQNVESLVEGVKLTIQQLLQALGKFGLSPIESQGRPFDPAFHEAMMVVTTDQHPPNHVVEELRKGYLLHDRLIRPATVSVSKPLEKETQPNG